MSGARLQWGPIFDQAAAIVASYDTPVTLRQLFYRLVTATVIPNSSAYKTLSNRTAEARREGWFPALADTREKSPGTQPSTARKMPAVSGSQAVDEVDAPSHRGREPDAVIGAVDVVVHGLRYGND